MKASTVRTPIAVRLFIPSWMQNASLKLNGNPLQARLEQGFLVARLKLRPGDALTLDSSLKNWVRPTHNPHSLRNHHVFHAGPLLLGCSPSREVVAPATSELVSIAPGRFKVRDRDVMLERINDVHLQPSPQWDPIDIDRETPDRMSLLHKALLFDANSHERRVLFSDVAG